MDKEQDQEQEVWVRPLDWMILGKLLHLPGSYTSNEGVSLEDLLHKLWSFMCPPSRPVYIDKSNCLLLYLPYFIVSPVL